MGRFCGGGGGNTTQSTASANAERAASEDGSQEKYDNLSGFEKALQDVQMDLGIIPKDNQYYANLDDRQERSQQAMQDMLDRRNKKDNKRQNERMNQEAEEEVEEVSEETGTVLDEGTNEALEEVENIADDAFGGGSDAADNQQDNTGGDADVGGVQNEMSAEGQVEAQEEALADSAGPAEDEAIGYMTSGTGSNILTSPQGLLADDDDEDVFNRKKTLIGA